MGHRPLFAALTAAGLAVATLAMVPASAVEETDDAEAPPQETPAAQVRHIHASGYLKAGPRAFARDMAALQARTDIVTTTEVPHRVKSRSLRGNGWRRVWDPAPGYNENAISVRKEVWTVDEFDAHRLASKGYWRLNGNRARPATATTALLSHTVTGEKLVVSVSHLPSLVEGKRGLNRQYPARARAYRASLRGWRRHVQKWVARTQPDGVIVTADWNLDVKKRWVRQFLRDRTIPGSRPSFTARFPRRGTVEGSRIAPRRLVDFAMSTGLDRTAPSKILRNIRSSDHHPVEHTWRFSENRLPG